MIKEKEEGRENTFEEIDGKKLFKSKEEIDIKIDDQWILIMINQK